MNNILCILIILWFSALSLTVQEEKQGSVKELEEFVVTGQINPQSVKESVFEVSVITREEIERKAGNNLADVLSQTLNLTIIPSSSTGKSKVELFGLDGQYLKILVDNVPLMNEEGMGNITDLTQINIDDIERIEIVEGAMGVQYGSNAIAGVINIIAKKGTKEKWSINAYLQEETVGNEYGVKDKGRHIQNIQTGFKFAQKWFASVVLNRNDFRGLYANKKGEFYDQNDKLRGYDWLPKVSWNAKALLNFSAKNTNVYYKFEYLNEDLSYFNPTVQENYNAPTLTSNPSVSDRRYMTERIYNTLNGNGKSKNSSSKFVWIHY